MTLFKLKKDQRKLYADKLIDLSHLIAAGLIIGQFISDKPFSYPLAVLGILLFVVLYFVSYTLTK